jgi:hypothetical protein
MNASSWRGNCGASAALWGPLQRSRFDLDAALEHLELAQWHVDSGYGLVQRQRQIVLSLERDGQLAQDARTRLIEYEQSQLARIAHRDQLASVLGASYASPAAPQISQRQFGRKIPKPFAMHLP